MYLYIDIFTGNEVVSDAFPNKEDEDGIFLEVTAKSISIDGSIDESLIGGNKSADGADGDDEGTDDQVEKVNAIIKTFNYMDVTLEDPQDKDLSKRKKDLKRRLVAYVKKLKEKKKEDNVPDADIKTFAEKAGARMNAIFKNFGDLSYYIVNEDYDEGCVPIGRHNDDGSITFYYFLDGLTKEKS